MLLSSPYTMTGAHMSYNREYLDLLKSANIELQPGDRLPPGPQPERPAVYTTRRGRVSAVSLWVAPTTGKARKHRVMVRCWCGRECTAGKYFIHLKTHKEG